MPASTRSATKTPERKSPRVSASARNSPAAIRGTPGQKRLRDRTTEILLDDDKENKRTPRTRSASTGLAVTAVMKTPVRTARSSTRASPASSTSGSIKSSNGSATKSPPTKKEFSYVEVDYELDIMPSGEVVRGINQIPVMILKLTG